MRREDFVVESDVTTQRLENELLSHEVAYLRAKLEAASASPRPATTLGSEDAATLAQARKDLRWILTRLSIPPIGWLLRRRSGFQNLWNRWMEPTDQP